MESKTPEAFVKLLNEFAFIDIGIVPSAASCECGLAEVPSDYKAALKLLDKKSCKFLLELNKGKPEIKHGVQDFDLTEVLRYYDGEYSDLKKTRLWIKEYFKCRKVDVIHGKGEDKEEYGFTFDWILVLDPESKVLFTFILNLED